MELSIVLHDLPAGRFDSIKSECTSKYNPNIIQLMQFMKGSTNEMGKK